MARTSGTTQAWGPGAHSLGFRLFSTSHTGYRVAARRRGDRPDLPWAKEAQPRKTAPPPPPQNVLASLTLPGDGWEAARGLEWAVWECAPVPPLHPLCNSLDWGGGLSPEPALRGETPWLARPQS